jgi:hypothetical protein
LPRFIALQNADARDVAPVLDLGVIDRQRFLDALAEDEHARILDPGQVDMPALHRAANLLGVERLAGLRIDQLRLALRLCEIDEGHVHAGEAAAALDQAEQRRAGMDQPRLRPVGHVEARIRIEAQHELRRIEAQAAQLEILTRDRRARMRDADAVFVIEIPGGLRRSRSRNSLCSRSFAAFSSAAACSSARASSAETMRGASPPSVSSATARRKSFSAIEPVRPGDELDHVAGLAAGEAGPFSSLQAKLVESAACLSGECIGHGPV